MLLRLLLCSVLYYNSYSQPHNLNATEHAKKCELYAGVTGTAVYDSETNNCYICETPPHNNTYNTVTKLCSNGELPFTMKILSAKDKGRKNIYQLCLQRR